MLGCDILLGLGFGIILYGGICDIARCLGRGMEGEGRGGEGRTRCTADGERKIGM